MDYWIPKEIKMHVSVFPYFYLQPQPQKRCMIGVVKPKVQNIQTFVLLKLKWFKPNFAYDKLH